MLSIPRKVTITIYIKEKTIMRELNKLLMRSFSDSYQIQPDSESVLKVLMILMLHTYTHKEKIQYLRNDYLMIMKYNKSYGNLSSVRFI